MEEGLTIKVTKLGEKWAAEIGPPHHITKTGRTISEALTELAYTIEEMESD